MAAIIRYAGSRGSHASAFSVRNTEQEDILIQACKGSASRMARNDSAVAAGESAMVEGSMQAEGAPANPRVPLGRGDGISVAMLGLSRGVIEPPAMRSGEPRSAHALPRLPIEAGKSR
jgi:hypothetical protein